MEGNAGGEVLACDDSQPVSSHLRLGTPVRSLRRQRVGSWPSPPGAVHLRPSNWSTRPSYQATGGQESGPGAVGVGWDGAVLGLAAAPRRRVNCGPDELDYAKEGTRVLPRQQREMGPSRASRPAPNRRLLRLPDKTYHSVQCNPPKAPATGATDAKHFLTLWFESRARHYSCDDRRTQGGRGKTGWF